MATCWRHPHLTSIAIICSNVEHGLLGIAIDPNFATNNYVYLFYTYNNLGNTDCPLGDPSPNNPVNRV